MPALTGGQKALLRTHPHTSLHYLAVLRPTELVSAAYGGGTNTGAVFTAQVDSLTVDATTFAVTEITYKNTTGSWHDAKQHFMLWVGVAAGSQSKGRVRLRKDTNATKLFPAALSHINIAANDWLTVYPYVEPLARFSREVYDAGPPETLTLYKDWDIGYTDKQNEELYPVAMMEPPGAAWLSGGSASVYFNGATSYGMGGAAVTDYAWEFPGGTPATSAIATPGNVTWSAAGQYVCSLEVTDDNGNKTKTYRTIFIDDFYTDFIWDRLSGDAGRHGWEASFQVFGDADATEFAEGTMVMLVTQEWYGTTLRSFGGNRTGRHNIRYVGWIVEDTTTKDSETSTVSFDTVSPLGMLRLVEPPASVMLNDVAGSPTTWYELKNMTVQKAIHHYLYWHTTLFFMTDIGISTALSAKLFERDYSLTEPVSALEQFLETALAWWGSDRTGCIYFELDPDLLASPDDDPAPRAAVPTTMLLEHSDWQEKLTITIAETKECNFLEAQGFYYTGGGDQDNATGWISCAPGQVRGPSGSGQNMQDLTMPVTQAAANKLAGLLLAKLNNPVPSIPITLMGNYAVFDIVPVHWTTLSIAAGDTNRGIVWSEQRMLPRRINEKLSNETGTILVDVEFSKEAYGPAGVTGQYPSDDEPEPDYTPPTEPVTPIPETIDSWGGIWVLGILGQAHKPGIIRTEDLGDAAASVPVWAQWTTGIDMVNYPHCRGLERDPWHPNTRVYALMHDTPTEYDYGLVLYRRVYSAGAWGSWTAILNEAVIESTLGYAIINGTGWISRPGVNINAEGHVYVMVTVERASDSWMPQYFFKSTDYGATWSAVRMAVQPENSPQVEPMCCVVGMLKGTSAYGAGSVIYCGYRNRSAFHYPAICFSPDGGATWANVAGGSSGDKKGIVIQIDPNDQSIFFTHDAIDTTALGNLWKYTSHGSAGAAVAAFSSVSRAALCKVGTATTMHAAAGTVLKVSIDGGTSVTSISVTGNIAGCGIPLNWDWNLLMALHSYYNGIAVTKALQISPDGGTTWYDKTGNIDNDWPNCYGAINVGFCLDD